MLSEVLGRILFGQSCAVQELPLQKGEVGLQKHFRKKKKMGQAVPSGTNQLQTMSELAELKKTVSSFKPKFSRCQA